MKTVMRFWILSFAEPASTIAAASVPIIRVLFRDVIRTGGYSKKSSSKAADAYLRSGNAQAQIESRIRRTPQDPHDVYLEANEDAGSDRSILAAQKQMNMSIMRTTEVSVAYGAEERGAAQLEGGAGDSYEMSTRTGHRASSGARLHGNPT
jgi:hypothetical protein